LDAIPDLNRPVPYEGKLGDFELWGQYDYSGKGLEFLSNAKTLKTTSVDKHSNYVVGLNLGLIHNFQLRYNYLYSEQKVIRSKNPKNINTEYDGHDVRLQYTWDFSPSWYANLQAGYRNHKVSPVNLNTIDSGGLKNIHATDPSGNPVPVLRIASSDSAYLFGASLTKTFIDQEIQITMGLEGRFVEIEANMTSPALSNLLASRLPQVTPWKEQHLIFTAAFEWHVWKPFSVAMDFKHYQIWRENYIPKAGKQDYNTNQQFDFYLFANVYKGLALYGHAQIMTHYLLGEVPLSYNTRTNGRFDQVYGFVSGGVTYRF